MFLLTIATACLYSHCVVSSTYMIGAKERSSIWWEQVVNSTITDQEWLQNFHVSHSTIFIPL